ncbi:unnamed protein product [Symbiodinium natans]|uniref:Uncharacterized protein n=1 Tax=Symbiodinium natans TaxID=878477 RepID=A0A812KD48_9DINO|nr:unnamed protein product [Symbiodinium natans]
MFWDAVVLALRFGSPQPIIAICSARISIMALARAVAAVVMAMLAAVLQGCGCNTESFASCTVGSGCDALTTYMTCVKDAGCCDYEVGGAKVKDSFAALESTANALAALTGGTCTASSPC